MTDRVAVLDSDTLSELARGNPQVTRRAREYLVRHGRLTFTSVTVFERLRGYEEALRAGRRYQEQLRQFEALAAASVVLPFDDAAAEPAARARAGLARRARRSLGDIMIAAIAVANALPLVTRKRRDFLPITELLPGLALLDWTV